MKLHHKIRRDHLLTYFAAHIRNEIGESSIQYYIVVSHEVQTLIRVTQKHFLYHLSQDPKIMRSAAQFYSIHIIAAINLMTKYVRAANAKRLL